MNFINFKNDFACRIYSGTAISDKRNVQKI